MDVVAHCELMWASVSRVFLGLYYVVMTDCVIGHLLEFNRQLPSLLGGQSADITWLKAPTPTHTVGLLGMASLPPELIS